jgi:hypothetical protein
VTAIVLVCLAYLLIIRRRSTTTEDDHNQDEAQKVSRHELESPDLKYPDPGSPVTELPAKKAREEMESPVPELLAEYISATNRGIHVIPRKPVAELP